MSNRMGQVILPRPGAAALALPGYTLLEELGEGGMGVVWRAREEHSGRVVALKLLSGQGDGELATRRFRREFRAAASIRHPHVAAVHDLHAEAPFFYTMECVSGLPLDEWFERAAATLDAAGRDAAVRALVGQVLVALAEIHQAGLVHRDLKPANVLIADRLAGAALGFEPPPAARPCYQPIGGTLLPFAKVLDFGLAWGGDQSGELTRTGIIVGTIDYVAPEQVLDAEVDGRADLYALGVILYELLAGRPPFEAGETVALLLKHAYEVPAPPGAHRGGVDPGLEGFAMRLLAKDPADRFPSAGEALRVLMGEGSAEDRRRSVLVAGHGAARPRGLLPPRFVGRDEPLDAARQALGAAGRGEARSLLVLGEGGLGKSRLLEELKKEARMRGFAVHAGSAHAEQGYALAPFLPILESMAREAAAGGEPGLQAPARALARMAPGFARLLEPGSEPLPPLGSEEERFRILAAITDLARILAARRPLLLVLEDLQWADAASLELLGYLARNVADAAERAPFLLAASLREEEVEPDSPAARARDALRRAPGATEIRLAALSCEQVDAMARSMLGVSELPGELLAWLGAESQGVPYLVVEHVTALAGDGMLIPDTRGRVDLRRRVSGEIDFPRELPPGVAELVRRRLDRLADRERRVATAAAVIGPEVPFELLLSAAELDEDSLLDSLQVLLGRRLLVESRHDPDRFTFSSKVVRDVLLRDTLERRRRRLHARVLAALEARGGERLEDVVALAHHSDRAGDRPRALRYLVRAAALHAERLDHEPALLAARRALELIDAEPPAPAEPEALPELLARAGELETVLCSYERAQSAWERLLATQAARRPGSVLPARAALGLAEVCLRRGEYADAREQADEALGRLEGIEGAERDLLAGRAHTSLGRLNWHLGRPDEALGAFRAAFAQAELRGDETAQATALNNIGYAHLAQGEYHEAERHFALSLSCFRRRNHPLGVARSLEALATAGQRRGELLRAAEELGEAQGLMRKLGDRRGEAYCVVSLGNLEAWAGAWLAALERYDLAEATFAELGESRGVAFCASNRGRVLTSLGEYAAALDELRRALKIARKLEDRGEVGFTQLALAEMFREVGDPEEAARQDRDAVAGFREQGERYGLGLALSGAAATALALGDEAGARAQAREALGAAEAAGGMPEVEVRARILLARLDGSREQAERAAALSGAKGYLELEVLALAELGRLLLRQGDPSAARQRRAVARERLEDLAQPLVERRERFLRRPPLAALLAPSPDAGRML